MSAGRRIRLKLQPFGRREGFELPAHGPLVSCAIEQRADERGRPTGVEIEQHRLDRADRRRGERQRAIADGDQRKRADRFGCIEDRLTGDQVDRMRVGALVKMAGGYVRACFIKLFETFYILGAEREDRAVRARDLGESVCTPKIVTGCDSTIRPAPIARLPSPRSRGLTSDRKCRLKMAIP